MARLNRLRRDERGTSVIELALIAPILATLTIGLIDLSQGFSQKLILEQAAQRAIEKVMQGRSNITTMGTLKTEAAETAGVAASAVTTDFWLECNGVRASNYNTNCASGVPFARYISVRITKTYTPFFNYKFHNRAENTYSLTGAATVRIQ